MVDLVKRAADRLARTSNELSTALEVISIVSDAEDRGLAGKQLSAYLLRIRDAVIKEGQDNTLTLAAVSRAIAKLNQQIQKSEDVKS